MIQIKTGHQHLDLSWEVGGALNRSRNFKHLMKRGILVVFPHNTGRRNTSSTFR
jgi:hypothetical protein